MNCDEAKDLIAIAVFAKLRPDEAAALEDHLGRCPACAAVRARTPLRPAAADPEASEPRLPDWERSWDVIARRSIDGRRKPWLLRHPATWACAGAAALAAFFFVGLLTGRRAGRAFYVPVPAEAVEAGAASPRQAYADAVEPVLTDFLNRGAAASRPDLVELRRRILRAMREQTRLLKDLAGAAGDAAATELLDEMESVLISLSNLDPGDRASADHLDRAIRERRLRSRLRSFSGVNLSY